MAEVFFMYYTLPTWRHESQNFLVQFSYSYSKFVKSECLYLLDMTIWLDVFFGYEYKTPTVKFYEYKAG